MTISHVYRPLGNDQMLIKKIFNMITEETRGNIQLQPSLERMNLKTCTVKKGYKVPKTLSEIYDIKNLLIIRKLKEGIHRWTLLCKSRGSRVDINNSVGLNYLICRAECSQDSCGSPE